MASGEVSGSFRKMTLKRQVAGSLPKPSGAYATTTLITSNENLIRILLTCHFAPF